MGLLLPVLLLLDISFQFAHAGHAQHPAPLRQLGKGGDAVASTQRLAVRSLLYEDHFALHEERASRFQHARGRTTGMHSDNRGVGAGLQRGSIGKGLQLESGRPQMGGEGGALRDKLKQHLAAKGIDPAQVQQAIKSGDWEKLRALHPDAAGGAGGVGSFGKAGRLRRSGGQQGGVKKARVAGMRGRHLQEVESAAYNRDSYAVEDVTVEQEVRQSRLDVEWERQQRESREEAERLLRNMELSMGEPRGTDVGSWDSYGKDRSESDDVVTTLDFGGPKRRETHGSTSAHAPAQGIGSEAGTSEDFAQNLSNKRLGYRQRIQGNPPGLRTFLSPPNEGNSRSGPLNREEDPLSSIPKEQREFRQPPSGPTWNNQGVAMENMAPKTTIPTPQAAYKKFIVISMTKQGSIQLRRALDNAHPSISLSGEWCAACGRMPNIPKYLTSKFDMAATESPDAKYVGFKWLAEGQGLFSSLDDISSMVEKQNIEIILMIDPSVCPGYASQQANEKLPQPGPRLNGNTRNQYNSSNSIPTMNRESQSPFPNNSQSTVPPNVHAGSVQPLGSLSIPRAFTASRDSNFRPPVDSIKALDEQIPAGYELTTTMTTTESPTSTSTSDLKANERSQSLHRTDKATHRELYAPSSKGSTNEVEPSQDNVLEGETSLFSSGKPKHSPSRSSHYDMYLNTLKAQGMRKDNDATDRETRLAQLREQFMGRLGKRRKGASKSHLTDKRTDKKTKSFKTKSRSLLQADVRSGPGCIQEEEVELLLEAFPKALTISVQTYARRGEKAIQFICNFLGLHECGMSRVELLQFLEVYPLGDEYPRDRIPPN